MPVSKNPPKKDKPFSIKLGDMKPVFQKLAFEEDRSLHYILKKILRKEFDKIKANYS